jgi:hypothetical protein
MLSLSLDVIFILMDALPATDLSCLMRTCRSLYDTGMPLLVRRFSLHNTQDTLIPFLRFLCDDLVLRVSYIHQLKLDPWGISHEDTNHLSLKPALIRSLIRPILRYSTNLERLEVREGQRIFASASLVDNLVNYCRSLTSLDITTSSSWDVGSFLGRLRCPLRSLHIRAYTRGRSSERTLSLCKLVQFRDTLEELQVLDTKLVVEETQGEWNTWPRLQLLAFRTIPCEALLSRSFPNVKSLVISRSHIHGSVNHSHANNSTWQNLDVVSTASISFPHVPRCHIRLLAALMTPHKDWGQIREDLEELLETSAPSVLDLHLIPCGPADYRIIDVLFAVQRHPGLRCLRLDLLTDKKSPVTAKLIVCKLLTTWSKVRTHLILHLIGRHPCNMRTDQTGIPSSWKAAARCYTSIRQDGLDRGNRR